MTDILPLLRDRWSTRSFRPDHEMTIEQAQIIVEAARWAPSARNYQPWMFAVALRNDPLWQQLAPAVAGYSPWAMQSSTWIINIAQPRSETSPSFPDFTSYDLGAAVLSQVIQAESMGLKCCQFANFDHSLVKSELELSSEAIVFTITAIGKAKDQKPERDRLRIPLSNLILTR